MNMKEYKDFVTINIEEQGVWANLINTKLFENNNALNNRLRTVSRRRQELES